MFEGFRKIAAVSIFTPIVDVLWMRAGPWALGDAFTLADCAAAPSLFYANEVVPFGDGRKHLTAYFARLMERPSFARAATRTAPSRRPISPAARPGSFDTEECNGRV